MPAAVFDNWRAGESGTRGTRDTFPQWHGNNVQLYDNGAVGPRPGWKDIFTSGWSFDFTSDDFVGILHRYEPSTLTDSDGNTYGSLVVAYKDFTNLYLEEGTLAPAGVTSPGTQLTYTVATHPVASAGFPPGHGVPYTYFMWHDGQELTIVGGAVFEDFDTTSPVVSNPNTSDGYPSKAWVHRDRAYYYGFSSKPGRIYYSDPADYATVGSTSYFDVTYNPDQLGAAVIAMWSISNTLLIALRDGTYLALSGVSPETGALRPLGKSRVPSPADHAVVWNEEVWFLSKNGWGINRISPSNFDTQSGQMYRPALQDADEAFVRPGETHQPVVDLVHDYAYFPTREDRKASSRGDMNALVFVNGSWTYETWETQFPANAYPWSFTGGHENRLYAAFMREDQTDTDLQLYSRNFTLNRPGRTDDLVSTSLHDEFGSTGYGEATLQLADILAKPGFEIKLERVVVEFDYWSSTGYETPSIIVTPQTKGIAGAADSDQAVPAAVTIASGTDGEPTWATSTGDTPELRTSLHSFADDVYGTAISLSFKLESTAIRRVTVIYDEREIERGR